MSRELGNISCNNTLLLHKVINLQKIVKIQVVKKHVVSNDRYDISVPSLMSVLSNVVCWLASTLFLIPPHRQQEKLFIYLS